MTTIAVADAVNGAVFHREVLDDGSTAWVAEDTELDGCIAQASTREEAAAALEENRRNYVALQAELRSQQPIERPVAQQSASVSYVATDNRTPVHGQALTWANS